MGEVRVTCTRPHGAVNWDWNLGAPSQSLSALSPQSCGVMIVCACSLSGRRIHKLVGGSE